MNNKRKKIEEKIGFFVLCLCFISTLFFLGSIIYFLASKGTGIITWEFLTTTPKASMTKGGIAPAILGTFYLTIGAVLLAFPLGLSCAIYLCEYSPKGVVINLMRLSINNLAGVPSVVFGLFGLVVFVKYFNFGISILSGSLTLGIMALPGIISSAQEALMAVPNSYREASLALGATHWQTIKNVVVPSAMHGILTGVILSIGRIAGETAPVLFTAAAFYTRGFPKSIFSETQVLPYQIYALMTEGTHPEEQTAIAYGAAFILLVLVLFISGIAIYFRQIQRSKNA